ncbi:MAG: type 2 lanthipeptide synthetase LanM family protein, partial [Ilumatobacteraceae bacterium]
MSSVLPRPSHTPATVAPIEPARPATSTSTSDGFLTLVATSIEAARATVRAGLTDMRPAERGVLLDPDRIEAALYAAVPDRLIRMLSRTLVLEMRVADLRGLLDGDTPQQRYDSFIQRLAEPAVASDILDEYGVLADLVTATLQHWVAASIEFAEHLCEDWPQLTETFGGGGELGALVSVVGGAGDLHRGGRSVIIAEFASGTRVVYKPRSMAADVHVQELLSWLNERGAHAPFRTITVLDQHDHGWMEFVVAAPSTSLADAHRYYQRLGGLLAVGYMIDAIDLHFENVIAVGADPVLLDLETLFHPQLAPLDEHLAWERAIGALYRSVIATGLLPHRMYGGATDTGMDVSGIGTTEMQRTPFAVPRWADAGTADMRMTREHAEFTTQHNRTLVDGRPTDPSQFSDDLVNGFTAMFDLFRSERTNLLAADGPIERFAADEVRVLLRPTRTYFRLLDESHHPDVLRDAAERDRLFDHLHHSVQVVPALARTVDAERADLWQGDVPLFTTTPSSHDLFTSSGGRISELLPNTGLDVVRRRLLGLNDSELRRQQWLIRASLSTLASGWKRTAPPAANRSAGPSADHDRLVAAAAAVGDRLVDAAILGEHDVSWLGLTTIGESGARLEPLGVDLYDGLAGVALFLGHLGASADRPVATRLAQTAIRTVQQRIAADELPASIGAFSGIGGIIYACTSLGRLWNDETLLSAAGELVHRIEELVSADAAFDVVGGSAGAILALAPLSSGGVGDHAGTVALRCGDHLLAAMQQQAIGRATPSPIPGGAPLTGMSHGAAGVAAALIEMAGRSGHDRFALAAAEVIAYEQSRFVPVASNWADLRFEHADDAGTTTCQTAWCHGAPGIGLARLRALRTA